MRETDPNHTLAHSRWGQHARRMLALLALGGALAGCAREPAYSAATPILQPTPDKTVDAILRGLSQPAVAASPVPTIAPPADTTARQAPVQRAAPAVTAAASDAGAALPTRPAAPTSTSPPVRAVATPTLARPTPRPVAPPTSTPAPAPQRVIATPAAPTLPPTPVRTPTRGR